MQQTKTNNSSSKTTGTKKDGHNREHHGHHNREQRETRLERHSASGTRGSAKKDGYSGTGGWGKPGTGEDGEGIIDQNDPNYDSDQECEERVFLPKYTTNGEEELHSILLDYLSNGDLAVTIPAFNKFFDEQFSKKNAGNEENSRSNAIAHLVKKALYIAFDRKAYERELVSRFLSSGYGDLMSRGEVELGFREALIKLEDVVLDSPEAPQLLAKFMARAIADDILSPSFITNEKSKAGKTGMKALELGSALATETGMGERLSHIWGPGDLLSVKRLKKESMMILKEYLLNSDLKEAENSIRKINAPSFHFQIVKIAFRLGIESGPSERTKIISILKHFHQVSLVSEQQIEQGVKCVVETLNDLKLDVPSAPSLLDEMIQLAKAEKLLSDSFSIPKNEK